MLKLSREHWSLIRRHSEEGYPNECCGVLLGVRDGDVREVRLAVQCVNARDDVPRKRYLIEPKELIRIQKQGRERGLEIVGFYHSHPDHPAQWSKTDFKDAHWIGCSYVITSVERGRAAETNSFALTGTMEEDKAFVSEEVVVSE